MDYQRNFKTNPSIVNRDVPKSGYFVLICAKTRVQYLMQISTLIKKKPTMRIVYKSYFDDIYLATKVSIP